MKKKYLLLLVIIFISINGRCLFANENIKIYRPYDGMRVNLDKLNETGILLSNNWSESDSAAVIFKASYDSVKIVLDWGEYRAGFNDLDYYKRSKILQEWDFSNINNGEKIYIKWDNSVFMLPDSYFEETSLYAFPERFHLYQDEDQDICAMIDSLRKTDFHKNYWRDNGIFDKNFSNYNVYKKYPPIKYLEDPWNRGEIWGTIYHKNGKRLMAGEYDIVVFAWNKGNKNNPDISGKQFFIERKDEDAAFKYHAGNMDGLGFELEVFYEGYPAKIDSVTTKAYEEGILDSLHPYPMSDKEAEERENRIKKYVDEIIDDDSEDDSNDGSKNEIPHKNNKTTDKKM